MTITAATDVSYSYSYSYSYSKKNLESASRPDSSGLTPRPAGTEERIGLAFQRYLEGLALFVDGIQRGLLAQLLDHGRQ